VRGKEKEEKGNEERERYPLPRNKYLVTALGWMDRPVFTCRAGADHP